MVLRLEVFESEDTGTAPNTIVLDTSLLEEAKLASYDAGYSAGWEDAAAAFARPGAKVIVHRA